MEPALVHGGKRDLRHQVVKFQRLRSLLGHRLAEPFRSDRIGTGVPFPCFDGFSSRQAVSASPENAL